jgi:hypothetical protein
MQVSVTIVHKPKNVVGQLHCFFYKFLLAVDTAEIVYLYFAWKSPVCFVISF